MKLSIIIPVYNEEKTVRKILDKVIDLQITGVEKEIIIVNDGSTDKTQAEIKKFMKHKRGEIIVLSHKSNKGKGSAVILGIQKAKGTHIIIQDADLEYNPDEIKNLVVSVRKKLGDVIYGTRLKRLPHFRNEEKTFRFMTHYFGNRILSFMTSMLYGQWITDMETCYKLFPKKAVEHLKIRARGFEFEPEITAKLLKQKLKIYEVPINATPRGYREGKKLRTVHDGMKAVIMLIKYRFVD